MLEGGSKDKKKGANLSTKETFLVPRNRNEVCWRHYLSRGVRLTRERVVVQTAARDAAAERVVLSPRSAVLCLTNWNQPSEINDPIAFLRCSLNMFSCALPDSDFVDGRASGGTGYAIGPFNSDIIATGSSELVYQRADACTLSSPMMHKQEGRGYAETRRITSKGLGRERTARGDIL